MEARNLFRLRFAGVALGVLAALLVWPGTRWLVRTQAACIIPGPATAWSAASGLNSGGPGAVARLTHAEAARLPEDYPVQLADAVLVGHSVGYMRNEKIVNLRNLARRFPTRPSVYANTLRFATQGPVLMHRDEGNVMVTGAPEHTNARQSDPAQIAAFDRDAAEGERLDPENAYFPMMRAIGLFDAHRDAEALQALHRAAYKPLWIEYYEDELEGEIRLHNRMFGDSGILPKVGFYAALLLPQYAQLRGVSRLATALAMKAEQSGHVEQGLAIREDVLRCSGLIRSEGRTVIGNLVGSAMAIVALQRPGGAPVIDPKPHRSPIDGPSEPVYVNAKTGKEMRDRLAAQFDAFLKQSGHSELSARAHAEMDAAGEVREIAVKNRDHDVFGVTLWQLGLSWWTDVQLLCAALWTLALGAVAALVYWRSRGLRSGRALPYWASRGITLGSVAALLSGVVAIPAAKPTTLLWAGSVLICGILAAALPAASRADRARALGAYAAALVASGCFLMLFAWHVNAAVDPMRKVVVMLMFGGEQGAEPVDRGFQMMFMGSSMADLGYHLATVAAAAIVPIVAALTFWFAGKVNRVPLSVALVRGFRGCAVPIACALLLAYAALLPITLRLESTTDEGVRNSLRHEGRYFASLSGAEWPGRMP